MPAIGHVTKQTDGSFKGELRTLSIRVPIEILPNRAKANDVLPDYCVLAGGVETGAGWLRRSEASGKIYVSLSLAAPEFGPRRLYATLVAGEEADTFSILWTPAD